jgi:hypothetical protein
VFYRDNDLVILDESLDLRARESRQQVGEKLVQSYAIVLRLDDELVVLFGQG